MSMYIPMCRLSLSLPLSPCSTYQSFMRLSLKLLYSERTEKGGGKEGLDCGLPHQALVKDVSVFHQKDSFSGLLVTLKDALSSSLNPPEFQIFFSPVSGYRRFENEGDFAKRILGLEVCTTYIIKFY